MPTDPKPAKRIKDPALLRNFSLRAGSCAVCGEGRAAGLQAHHVLHRGRGGDDVVANLAALCVSCHELYHAGDSQTRYLLGRHLVMMRPDVTEYLEHKLGFDGCQVFFEREYAEVMA